jgi:hypothetical protein
MNSGKPSGVLSWLNLDGHGLVRCGNQLDNLGHWSDFANGQTLFELVSIYAGGAGHEPNSKTLQQTQPRFKIRPFHQRPDAIGVEADRGRALGLGFERMEEVVEHLGTKRFVSDRCSKSRSGDDDDCILQYNLLGM